MKKVLVFVLLVIVQNAFPQQKYFIYFKDKGVTQSEGLSKSSSQYQKAYSMLSERSIERRKKTLGEDNIISYGDLPVSQLYISQLKSLGIKIVYELNWFNSVSAYMNQETADKVKKLPFVDKVETVKSINFIRNEKSELNNSYKKQSSGTKLNYGQSLTQLQLSDIPAVHAKGITGQNIIIGLLDSGFDWKEHEALMSATVLGEHDFVFDDSITANQLPQDSPGQDNHGTLIFSVIGGYKDSTLIGAAYGAGFILAKTEYIPTETHVEEDNYAAALIWMEGKGVDVTSSSLGYNEFDSGQDSYTYQDMNGKTAVITIAAEEAFNRGVVTVTAAGNEGNTKWHYVGAPADGFNIIAVGAVDNGDNIASFSSRGPTSDGRIKPEVVAQGVGVYGASAHTFANYNAANGTSLSTPIAGGVAALLLSAYPHLTNVQVRKILLATSNNSENPNDDIGYGLLSASKAISFPNLQKVDNTFRINKAFIDKSNIVPSSVMVHYASERQKFSQSNMSFDNNFKYTSDLPQLNTNNTVSFYFTYLDSAGNTFREPLNNYYGFDYGDLNIIVNVREPGQPEDFVLAQNYPNPFNNQTKIDFVANLDEKAELIILDAIGQKVKTLFNGITAVGVNSVLWDGKNSNGMQAASGVYYYILKLNGKEFGKKMILLK